MSIYQKRYDKLINYYKNLIVEGYTERHHIIPKCMDGSDHSDNLVDLPAKAHYIAHLLLTKIHPKEPKILNAFFCMSFNPHGERHYTSIQFAKMREAKAQSQRGKNNSFYGKTHSKETKKLIGSYHKGKTISDGHKKILSERNKKHNIKPPNMKGTKRTDRDLIICPHCKLKSTWASNMTRYHFDNCKNK